ncbi:hypothetical protein JW879_04000 [candidate division WOR-3 bacterium]|nr:hypothetical protein [candidate division WOR-3 bacterium]
MRRKRTVDCIFSMGFYLLLLFSFFSFTLKADNSVNSKVTIDWKEFRSLLKLDVDEIRLSWDEFSRLMEQTGARYEPEYRVDNGSVVLTRQEFKKLVDSMKPPAGDELMPPADYILTKSTYNGVMGRESTTFTAVLNLEIFDRAKEAYLKIPLFQEGLAISEVRLDGRPASVITEGGWHYLSTNEVGRHSVSVRFSIQSSPDKGIPGLNFTITGTPVTYISLDIPKADLEISVQNAQEIIKTGAKGHTIIRGYLSSTSYVSISWKSEDKKIKRGPARIYSEVFNLLSIEADAISVTTVFELNIMQNTISVLTLAVPSDYQVIDVSGGGLAGWSVREEGGGQLLDIAFEYPFEGTKALTVKSEKLLAEETIVANFEGFEVLGAMRESGYVAGEVKSDAEAEVQEFNNIERIDFQKIPYQLSNLSARPILFAFRYVRHPFNMVVRITKYEKEEALTSFIDLAKGITLFMEDGKMVHQVTFTMQNLWDQFLKISLPADVSIWSVYVNGKREKASKGDDGRVLIPLARSERGYDGSLTPFDIELIYTEKVEGFNFLGKKKNYFPATDILINKAEWTLYLPVNYDYISFGGNLNPAVEEVIPPSQSEIEMKELPEEAMESETEEIELDDKSGVSAAAPVSKKAYDLVSTRQAVEFASGKAGLLSLKVKVPISGKKYSFEKKIVEKEEALFLGFSYANEIIIRTIIILLILILLFVLFRKRRIFIPLFGALGKGLVKLLYVFKLALRPREFIIIISVFLLLWILTRFYWYYPLLSFVLLLLFGGSIVRYVQNRGK